MGSTYYTTYASSFTTEDQRRIIEELSVDGTIEGIDLTLLQEKIALNPNNEDYAYLYTYLTGSISSNWDAELVDPDMIDDLEEWANLTTSTDLAADLQEFISLIGVDPALETALSTSSDSGEGATGLAMSLGGSSAFTGMAEAVSYANNYYTTSQAASAQAPKDFEALINLAFSLGNPMMALLYILKGTEEGDYEDGLFHTVTEGSEVVVEQIEDINEALIENMDIRETLDSNEDSAELTNLGVEDSMNQSKLSQNTQLLSTYQTIISETITACVKMMETRTATIQRINS